MKFALVVLLIGATGAAASYAAWRLDWIARRPYFRWSGLGLFVALLVLMRLSMRELHPADLFLIVMGCVWWTPFLAFFAADAPLATGADLRKCVTSDQHQKQSNKEKWEMECASRKRRFDKQDLQRRISCGWSQESRR